MAEVATGQTGRTGHAGLAEELIREHITDGKAEWVLGFFRCALQEARGLGFREGNTVPSNSPNPYLFEHRATTADGDEPTTRSVVEQGHDHQECCRYLRCAHPACCGYYGEPHQTGQ